MPVENNTRDKLKEFKQNITFTLRFNVTQEK